MSILILCEQFFYNLYKNTDFFSNPKTNFNLIKKVFSKQFNKSNLIKSIKNDQSSINNNLKQDNHFNDKIIKKTNDIDPLSSVNSTNNQNNQLPPNSLFVNQIKLRNFNNKVSDFDFQKNCNIINDIYPVNTQFSQEIKSGYIQLLQKDDNIFEQMKSHEINKSDLDQFQNHLINDIQNDLSQFILLFLQKTIVKYQISDQEITEYYEKYLKGELIQLKTIRCHDFLIKNLNRKNKINIRAKQLQPGLMIIKILKLKKSFDDEQIYQYGNKQNDSKSQKGINPFIYCKTLTSDGNSHSKIQNLFKQLLENKLRQSINQNFLVKYFNLIENNKLLKFKDKNEKEVQELQNQRKSHDLQFINKNDKQNNFENLKFDNFLHQSYQGKSNIYQIKDEDQNEKFKFFLENTIQIDFIEKEFDEIFSTKKIRLLSCMKQSLKIRNRNVRKQNTLFFEVQFQIDIDVKHLGYEKSRNLQENFQKEIFNGLFLLKESKDANDVQFFKDNNNKFKIDNLYTDNSSINVLNIFKKQYLQISNYKLYDINFLNKIKSYVIRMKDLDYMVPIDNIKRLVEDKVQDYKEILLKKKQKEQRKKDNDKRQQEKF